MSIKFIPMGSYEDIINTVGKWKIIDLLELQKKCRCYMSYFNLSKKVRKLEEKGLLSSAYASSRKKYIYLSNKGISYSKYDSTYEICDDNLTHDIITGLVLRDLLKFERFIDGEMFHAISKDGVWPDAEITYSKEDAFLKVAIEVELTQKKQDRVKMKYSRYTNCDYDYCFYITPSKTIYRAYNKYLEAMADRVRDKILIIFNSDLNTTGCDMSDSICFFKGEERPFMEMFGVKQELNEC